MLLVIKLQTIKCYRFSSFFLRSVCKYGKFHSVIKGVVQQQRTYALYELNDISSYRNPPLYGAYFLKIELLHRYTLITDSMSCCCTNLQYSKCSSEYFKKPFSTILCDFKFLLNNITYYTYLSTSNVVLTYSNMCVVPRDLKVLT